MCTMQMRSMQKRTAELFRNWILKKKHNKLLQNKSAECVGLAGLGHESGLTHWQMILDSLPNQGYRSFWLSCCFLTTVLSAVQQLTRQTAWGPQDHSNNMSSYSSVDYRASLFLVRWDSAGTECQPKPTYFTDERFNLLFSELTESALYGPTPDNRLVLPAMVLVCACTWGHWKS